jgi:hypothetical protein
MEEPTTRKSKELKFPPKNSSQKFNLPWLKRQLIQESSKKENRPDLLFQSF